MALENPTGDPLDPTPDPAPEPTPPQKTAEDLARMQGALKKERERSSQLARKLEERNSKVILDDEELDPDELRAMLKERAARKGQQMLSQADAEKQWEDRRAKIAATHQAQLEEMKGSLYRVLVEEAIRRECANPANPFRLKPDAAQILINEAKLSNAIRVVDGRPMVMDGDSPATDAKGEPMAILDWIAATAQTKFPSTIMESNGAGAHSPVNGGSVVSSKKRLSEMTDAEKSAFIEAHGQEKFFELLFASSAPLR